MAKKKKSSLARQVGDDPADPGGALIRVRFRGPLPPPAQLQGYEDVVPGAGDRIISMAEELAKHEYSVESAIVTSEVKMAQRGQWFGFLSILFLGGLGGALLFLGHEIYGLTALVGTVVTALGGGIWNRLDERRERLDAKEEAKQKRQLELPGVE